MKGTEHDPGPGNDTPLACHDCREGLQEYLDGTLEKKQSLRFFLHLRECSTCQQEHELLQGRFEMLDNLPSREMEPLRRERVPVYLAEHFLPQFVRSRVTRWSGLGVTIAATVAVVGLDGPAWLPVAAVIGATPEILVRLQGLGRRFVALGRAEG